MPERPTKSTVSITREGMICASVFIRYSRGGWDENEASL